MLKWTPHGVNIMASWSTLHFLSSEIAIYCKFMYYTILWFHFFYTCTWASWKLFLTFTNKGGIACKITSVLRLSSTQFLSTLNNFRPHALHSNTSFFAFAHKNELTRIAIYVTILSSNMRPPPAAVWYFACCVQLIRSLLYAKKLLVWFLWV